MDYETEKHNMNSESRGFYTPSFFRIGINTVQDLSNYKKLDPQSQSTFFHEYIHFLQDITTTFGLVNISIVVDRMKYYNNDIIVNNSAFKTPYKLNKNFAIEINSDLQKVYIGNKDLEPEEIVSYSVFEKISVVMIPAPYNKPADFVELSYQTLGGTKRSINFGAHCIMESMAHIGQNFICKMSHNSIPYKTAQLVAKKTYSVIGDNDLFVFALCDASLMTYQPGLIFYRVLLKMKEDEFIPLNEREVYNYLFNYWNAENISLMSHFSWLAGFTNNQMLGYFTTVSYENEKNWIHAVLKKAHEVRIENPYFLLDIIKLKKLETAKFDGLINDLGTPLMMNANEETAFTKPTACGHLNIKPERLAAIFEIFKLLEYGHKKCKLTKQCCLADEELVDERCDEPWTRARDAKLCGYAHQWKSWGLAKFAPEH